MSESHASRGTRRGRRLLAELGAEIRSARLAAGATLAEGAAAAGSSSTELSRIERGLAPWLDITTAARVCAVVGLDLWMRTYPGPDPIRDAASARIFEALRRRLGSGLVLRSEVPIGDERDQRAWDHTVDDGNATAAIEVESRLHDAQALVRRINLKTRDSGVGPVILVLNDTRANRRAVEAAQEVLRGTFPLEPADVLAALRQGRVPAAGGIVFERPDRAASGPTSSRTAEAGANERSTFVGRPVPRQPR